MSEPQDTRTDNFETITLDLYGVPNYWPPEQVIAEAWEKAQEATARLFDRYGWSVRVEQSR